MSFDAFVCKISDKFIVLQEKDVPDTSWLRGKLHDALARDRALPGIVRNMHAMVLLDLDNMIDTGAARNIHAYESYNEKSVTYDLLSLLSSDVHVRRKPRSFGTLVERYRAVADYLGIANVPGIREELDALIAFPLPDCTYTVVDNENNTVANVVFLREANRAEAVIVYFGEKTWKLSHTVLSRADGNVFVQFAWPDTDDDSKMMKKKLDGLMISRQTAASGAIDLKIKAFTTCIVTNDNFTWQEYVQPVKCCRWIMSTDSSKKRPREPGVLEK